MGTEEKRDTMPAPPPDGVDVVIPKGQARAAVLLCMGELAKAIGQMETAFAHAQQLMQALARALDEESTTTTVAKKENKP